MIEKRPLGQDRPRVRALGCGAMELAVTPAQLALAWLLHQAADAVAIPGTRRPERIDESAQAAGIRLSAELLRRIDALARPGLAEGATLV